MKNTLKIILASFLLLGSASVFAAGNADKGQKIYLKKLKQRCDMTGGKFATLHTQDEWEEIFEEGNLANEIKELCPRSGELKEKYLEDLYKFFYDYASDSGNVPSC
jgi:hypothetical protein